jgi:hypothetical protein
MRVSLLMFGVFWASFVAAQERIYFQDIPDLQLLALAELGQPEALVSLGLGVATEALSPDLRAAVLLGARPSVQSQFKLSSSLRLSLDNPNGEGRHQLYARVGLGKMTSKSHGVDLETQLKLEHGGSLLTLRPELSGAPFVMSEVLAGLWLRQDLNPGGAMVMPLRVGARQVRQQRGPNARITWVQSGVGARDYLPRVYHGWLELVGLSYQATAFQAVTKSTSLTQVRQLDLRLLHVDEMAFRQELFGESFLIATSAFIGSSWLNASDNSQVQLLTGQASGQVQHLGRWCNLELGLGLSRFGATTLEARALAAQLRVEGLASVSDPDKRAGGSFRTAWEKLDSTGDTPQRRALVNSEWWFSLSPFAKIGLEHLASQEGELRWEHEVGAFVRASTLGRERK